MVYDFDGLAQSNPDKDENIWTISGSGVEIELEDRPALIRGRTRSDGFSRNERRPRSLSASGRRIASAVAKFVVKPKNGEEGSEKEEQSVVEFEQKESAETNDKPQTRFHRRRDSNQQHVVEDAASKEHDMKHVDQTSYGLRQLPSLVDIEEKSEKGGGVGSVVNMIGRVLSPRRLPRKKVIGMVETIEGKGKSPPESPLSPQQQLRHKRAAGNNSQFVEIFDDTEPIPPVVTVSPSETTTRIVSPFKAFGQRTFGSLLRHSVSAKTDATRDTLSDNSDIPSLTASLDKHPVGILRASSHCPVRRPSIENGSISQNRSLGKEYIGEKKSIMGSSEHGTRSTLLVESGDSSGTYSRTVSSLVSPRRKMASRKLDSAEVLQRAKARRQSGAEGSSDVKKRRGSSRSRPSQTSSDTGDKPKRRFSEGSGDTSASKLTTQTCYPSLHSERKRSTRESSRGRPRRSLETRSDHVSTTRRRSSSAFPTTSSDGRGKPQRRFSESSGNTATSKLTTKTCDPTLNTERMQSRREASRGRPRRSLEARSDHVSTACRSLSSRHSQKSSEARGKQNRRFSEGSGKTLPSRLTTRTCETKQQQSERTLSDKIGPNSERSNTPSRKKSSFENLKTSPPGSTAKRDGTTRLQRRSISNRSTTPSRTRSSLGDPKGQREAIKHESSDRSRSSQRTRQKSAIARTSTANDLTSSLNDEESAMENMMIACDSDHKEKQNLRKSASKARVGITGSVVDGGASKSEASKERAELDTNRFTSFCSDDFL
jgi:hypothetical protein